MVVCVSRGLKCSSCGWWREREERARAHKLSFCAAAVPARRRQRRQGRERERGESESGAPPLPASLLLKSGRGGWKRKRKSRKGARVTVREVGSRPNADLVCASSVVCGRLFSVAPCRPPLLHPSAAPLSARPAPPGQDARAVAPNHWIINGYKRARDHRVRRRPETRARAERRSPPPSLSPPPPSSSHLYTGGNTFFRNAATSRSSSGHAEWPIPL